MGTKAKSKRLNANKPKCKKGAKVAKQSKAAASHNGNGIRRSAKVTKAKSKKKTESKAKTRTPRKMGRPSGYNQEIAEKICTLISEGKSLRSICLEEGMPNRRTILNWILKNDEFYHQYARAREAQADFLFEQCLEIADHASSDVIIDANGKERTDWECVNRSRLRVDTRKWMAAKLAPKKYGDKLATEISGKDGKPIATSVEISFVSTMRERDEAIPPSRPERGTAPQSQVPKLLPAPNYDGRIFGDIGPHGNRTDWMGR
jgi:hypothetical protein